MSQQKRIIFTVTNDLSFDQRMQRICTTLSNNNYSVLLIGRKFKQSVPLSANSFQQKRITCWINSGPLFYAEYNIRLFFILIFAKFDALCGVDLDTLCACWLTGKMKGKPVLYDAHEFFPESPELTNRSTVKAVWQWLESFLIKRVNGVYTVSEGIQKIFNRKYDVKAKVIRNLPYLSKVQSEENGDTYMLYQGALNIGRGLEVLISIMPEIDCELWLAGEGDLSEELRQLASNIAPDKVNFLGRVDPAELKQITANAFIGVNLLEPLGLSYQLSLSNKFFDYIMAGIPQICIDFDEYRRINRELEIALLVPNLEKTILIDAVNKLLNDKILYNHLRMNCHQMKEHYNWEREEVKLLEVYKSI